ncbi:MAG: PAS domain-containing protein, partial [Alphaproteobacteria bacterium]
MFAETARSEPQTFVTAEAGLFAQAFHALQQRTGTLVPSRRAFAPSAVRTLLPYLGLLELQGPDHILVRLVGTAVINRGRVDMTGKNLLDFYPESERDRARRHHLRMLQTPCGSTFLSREEFGPMTTLVEIVNYPLADDAGEARFI